MSESWGCGLYTSAAYTRVFTVIIIKFKFANYLGGAMVARKSPRSRAYEEYRFPPMDKLTLGSILRNMEKWVV